MQDPEPKGTSLVCGLSATAPFLSAFEPVRMFQRTTASGLYKGANRRPPPHKTDGHTIARGLRGGQESRERCTKDGGQKSHLARAWMRSSALAELLDELRSNHAPTPVDGQLHRRDLLIDVLHECDDEIDELALDQRV